jgi:ubiquinone/menaquinone biosynthesis C-methylase UbiE
MNLLRMKGAWGGLHGALYESVVARACAPLYRRFVAEAVPDIPDGARVLDLGCGGGHVTSILAERFPRCGVTGVDLSPAQVRRARKRYDLPNLVFCEGDALCIPCEDQSVDLLTSVASIKHWPDRRAGLLEVFRVLVPGGTLCIVEANRQASHETCRAFVTHWRHVLPGTGWLLARYFRTVVAGQALALKELTGLLLGVGFTAIEARELHEHPFVMARATRPS